MPSNPSDPLADWEVVRNPDAAPGDDCWPLTIRRDLACQLNGREADEIAAAKAITAEWAGSTVRIVTASDVVEAAVAPGLSSSPCGSMRVTRWFEGTPAEATWCSRRSGPCPFPGTAAMNSDRRCADAPLVEDPES